MAYDGFCVVGNGISMFLLMGYSGISVWVSMISIIIMGYN